MVTATKIATPRTASPIVKWVGGKGRLLGELRARVPETFGRYYEPFAGGAALFFDLAPERAVLSDANAELMATYATVRDETDDVVHWLKQHAERHSDAHYYEVRNNWNGDHYRGPGQAAAFLYLNRVCFNGLWRVNADGEFNVPIGRYENPTICNASALRAAAIVLARAELRTGGYSAALHDVRAGDLVYLDPPYDDTFAGYTLDGFGRDQQRLLALEARELVARGINVIASNSDTPFIRELYDGFVIERVKCAHAVSGSADGRAVVAELIITGGPSALGEFMARRQTEIPGTRIESDVPLAVIEAGQRWLERKREARRLREQVATDFAGFVALSKANATPLVPLKDPDTGENLTVTIEDVTKVRVTRDRDELDDEFDAGDDVDFSDTSAGPHPSLLAAAERAQADSDAGVEQTEDGDIVTPDAAAPKAKRKKTKAKAKAKKS